MQIFACHADPEEAADRVKWSRHVIKMPLETIQILFTVWHLLCGGVPEQDGPPKTYNATHVHHPAVKWVAEAEENYRWLVRHGLRLCHNYHAFTERRHAEDCAAGKRRPLAVRQHACLPLIEWMAANTPPFERKAQTPFVAAINDEELALVRVEDEKGELDVCATYTRYAEPAEAEARARRNREKAAAKKTNKRRRVAEE